jgi:hypothetical protein
MAITDSYGAHAVCPLVELIQYCSSYPTPVTRGVWAVARGGDAISLVRRVFEPLIRQGDQLWRHGHGHAAIGVAVSLQRRGRVAVWSASVLGFSKRSFPVFRG